MNDVQKITEWSKRIHELALAKGWWKDGIENRSVAEIVANFHGEASEAWEEYRAGRMETWFSRKDEHGKVWTNRESERRYTQSPRVHVQNGWKPEGFWIEVGDLCIRIMDSMGAYGWSPQSIGYDKCSDIPSLILTLHFRMGYMVLFDQFDRAIWSNSAAEDAAWVMRTAFEAARRNNVDLWQLIELKHAYNTTRPIRHGGKLA